VRVWVDLTNSPHVLVLRPVIAALRARGVQVEVTARDFAQTLALCRRFGIEHTPIGAHAGRGVFGKAAGLARRSLALRRWARGLPRFDLALGHGSNDVTVAAAALHIPCSTMFDYEWATLQHQVNCRLARAVVVPEAIPPERLDRYGARGKLARYPGLKEEYYLADFEPDPAVLDELALDATRPLAVVRTPPAVSLYHRFENRCLRPCSNGCAAARPSCCCARASRRPSCGRREASSCPRARSTRSRSSPSRMSSSAPAGP